MTTVYLAYGSGADHTLEKHAHEQAVNLLVAYPMLKRFLQVRHKFNIDRWCLDSGAFSAWNSGKVIDLLEYISVCKDVDAREVFGLDVIGSGEGTRKNLEQMWEAGIEAIPTFHYGKDWKWLEWCTKNANKIALGGLAAIKRSGEVSEKTRVGWILQCFARIWPKKIHGFGCSSKDILEAAPFHSVDATSWLLGPQAFGRWAGYTGRQIDLKKIKGVKDFWIEIKEHLRRQEKAQFRWRNELALLEERG